MIFFKSDLYFYIITWYNPPVVVQSAPNENAQDKYNQQLLSKKTFKT